MKASFRLGRIFGIEVGIHYTWLLAFVLVTWTVAEGFFPEAYPGWERSVYWFTGGVAALLLFLSVLIHELAHSLVAKARGLPVAGITLFIFGGVSSISGESRSAGEEFAIAVVGPLTSIILAAVFWGGWQLVGDQDSPFSAILFYLAFLNLVLGVFNLLPGFPLDGGRVLRSIIWGATNSLYKATRIAATVGQVFAFMLIALGVFQVLAGNILGGVWIAFIGWFLNGAADASRKELVVQETLRGVRVAEVMDRQPEVTSPEAPVDVLVREAFMLHGKRALPVVDDGRLVGIVSITDVKEIEPERWPSTRVWQIMTKEPLRTVRPETDVADALNMLAEHDVNQVIVLQDGATVGILSREHIIRYLRLISDLGVSGRPGGIPAPRT